jgi:hypothetical protein
MSIDVGIPFGIHQHARMMKKMMQLKGQQLGVDIVIILGTSFGAGLLYWLLLLSFKQGKYYSAVERDFWLR